MFSTNHRRGLLALSLGLATLTGGLLLQARAQNGKAMPEPTGKITPWAAIKIAKAKVPGRALQANYEFDEGKWVYGVMVVSGGTIKEVEIDPTTGKVGDVETVTPDDEVKEMKDMMMKATGGKTAPAEQGEKKEADEKGEKGE